ncbi:MAG: hypothetical protein Q7U39_06440 [Nitrospira sp.]|nr:hypothetical protein [Nitrospira sp.]
MIKPLPDGRFRVVVSCADNKTRWRICAHEGTAKFFEAIFVAGWFNRFTAAPRRPRIRRS